MRSKKTYFENRDGVKLAARIDLPVDSSPQSWALFAHCFTCTKNLRSIGNIVQSLIANGIAVMRFDFTGLGESGGEFENTNYSSNVQDLIDAAKFMEENYDAPSLLVGHSLGGAAVISAGAKLDSVKAVAAIAAPSGPEHLKNVLTSSINEIYEKGYTTITIAGQDFKIKKQFIEDIKSENFKASLFKLNAPLLILHSPDDKIVGIENATEIYKSAMLPKSFIMLDGADHLLSEKKDSLYAGKVIASWAERYLDMPEPKELKTENQVAARLEGKTYTTQILAGGHRLTADEPEEVGGNNFGPSPYDLVSSALGACTAMTLRMYADRKKWDLDEVIVHLNHKKTYKEDSENPDNKKGKIDRFERLIELRGNLDEEQKQRLLEIANKCPVHKTLHSEVEDEAKLVEK